MTKHLVVRQVDPSLIVTQYDPAGKPANVGPAPIGKNAAPPLVQVMVQEALKGLRETLPGEPQAAGGITVTSNWGPVMPRIMRVSDCWHPSAVVVV
jgi:hypothetical protein